MVNSFRVHSCYFSENGGDFQFERKLEKDKCLKVFLKISKEEDEDFGTLWGVEGNVKLVNGKITKEHSIELWVLKITQGMWIGSWHPIFVKDDSENCIDEIPLEELGSLADEPLVDLHAARNGINIDSDFLELIEKRENSKEIQNDETTNVEAND